ncbi:MAG: hypothetical protein ISS74_09915 [Planctomycetes bacterium]|nr:hypothetical protein [Planctomycetota bacterium]
MARICIAGVAPGIGKTTVAEMLLGHLDGWHAARVRVADEIPDAHAPHLADAGYALLRYPDETGPDAELARLVAAGAAGVRTLLAEPRGLTAGIEALADSIPAGGHLLIEGNAYLWAAEADLAVMVVGPGPAGKGLARVRPSVRELFGKIHVWVWSARTEPAEEGFFEFPQALARMGFATAVTNAADFHHVSPGRAGDTGRKAFLEAVRRRLEEAWVRRGSDEFLRRIGFKK